MLSNALFSRQAPSSQVAVVKGKGSSLLRVAHAAIFTDSIEKDDGTVASGHENRWKRAQKISRTGGKVVNLWMAVLKNPSALNVIRKWPRTQNLHLKPYSLVPSLAPF